MTAWLFFTYCLSLPSLHLVRVEFHDLFSKLYLHPGMKSVLHVLLTTLQRCEQHISFLPFRCRVENLLSYHRVYNCSVSDEPSDRSANFLIALRLFYNISSILLFYLTNTLLNFSQVVALVLIYWWPKTNSSD